ncbi:MAG: hypothetical protein LBL96_03600 [Clostridiales bacterium]|jgi:hypothetical protein|nr:hypothetical protein [Clostridiales bacterium]
MPLEAKTVKQLREEFIAEALPGELPFARVYANAGISRPLLSSGKDEIITSATRALIFGCKKITKKLL